MAICSLCQNPGGKLVSLTKKGKDSLENCAKQRNDARLQKDFLNGSVSAVHEECRKNYTNRKRIASINKSKEETELKSCKIDTRSMSDPFEWKTDCFLCGEHVDQKHKSRNPFHPVRTVEIRSKLLEDCQMRLKINFEDDHTTKVQRRLLDCVDLVAVNAIYHQQCRVEFSKAQDLISSSTNSKTNVDLKQEFEKACT